MPSLTSTFTTVMRNVSSVVPDAVKPAAKAPTVPHPLDQLRIGETEQARQITLTSVGQSVLEFRSIFLEEPPKEQLLPFLEAERKGEEQKEIRPPRVARVQYDIVHPNKDHELVESLVDLEKGKVVFHEVIHKDFQPSFTMTELRAFQDACVSSQLYKDAIAEFQIPKGFVVTIDPWPYGGPDPGEDAPRYTQGLCFARDASSKNEDANHYGYPIPIIPVLDTYKKEIVRVDRLATGGKEDGMAYGTHNKNVIDHCVPSDYVPELLKEPMRTDLKPLNVVQPQGPSFSVSNDSLVEWQKWRFRVGFNGREGATIHDVTYDGRSVLYRLSMSEMTVPYGDPRPPFHRKQAFDFGDGGAGRAANNLELGCDCLGVIKYLDGVMIDNSGKPSVAKNVVCIHEQDNGVGWKHTNYRTGRAVVARSRELVVQFIITLANYDYVFAFKFDQAGGITVETRATGIVSVVNIDPGKTSPYGNVVAPGALAQNHQHIFCIRIDPSIDGPANTIFKEESFPVPMNPKSNPFGNAYEIKSTPVVSPSYFDASPSTNLTVKMTNPKSINPISGKAVAYKFIPPATQLLLAHPESISGKRAQFAQHHVWVTKYKDGEFYAGGEYTNQTQTERSGVADATRRGGSLAESGDDVVVWNTFGLTHNPRVEDWPVMPVEIHQFHMKPADFFTKNPALDVPSTRNLTSQLAPNGVSKQPDCCNGVVQQESETHWQGGKEGELTPAKA